ncbi:HAMP domain-containing histidine kinase [Exiguobacterium sp. SH4S7]|uniref:HAMP domain-containing sensor histidine kinase n=1 Tax=Exiguobacterium sp. SH4S7 TaxID=2510958 RepID=UPI00103FA869|nr:HAMP domain-containing sensor histidine kinase [Exiguobacterium sp. SH4S7]TCI34056.1 HAMP domain-containing histidine kinase [Exiguobacterium sp. SH4S7]
MKRFFSSIYGRFLTIFFGLLLIPILLTLTLFLTFQMNALTSQVETMLVERAESMLTASERYELGADEVIDLFSERTLIVETDLYAAASWSVAERARLERGDVLTVSDERLPAVTLLIDRTVVTLSPNADENPVTIFRDLSFQTLLLTALVSSVLVLFAVRLMTRRIDRVTEAASKVASGDLTVRVHDGGDDEIGKLASQFNQMTETLATNESKNEELTAIMAHEFKTPVASILGYATLLKRADVPTEKRVNYATMIEQEGKRLSRLSRDLLRLAKLDHSVVGLDVSRFSLSEQMRESILSFERESSRKRLNLIAELDEVEMVGDAGLLHQVWINLIQNAMTHSYDGGTIRIKLMQTAESIVCEITDDGEGMTPEQVSRMYERFYQADPSRHQGGSGLGMAIVQKIVTLHGGHVDVTSELKSGTTVRVTLPDQKDR